MATNKDFKVKTGVNAQAFNAFNTPSEFQTAGGMVMAYNGSGIGVLRAYSNNVGAAGTISFTNVGGVESFRIDSTGVSTHFGMLKVDTLPSAVTATVSGGSAVSSNVSPLEWLTNSGTMTANGTTSSVFAGLLVNPALNTTATGGTAQNSVYGLYVAPYLASSTSTAYSSVNGIFATAFRGTAADVSSNVNNYAQAISASAGHLTGLNSAALSTTVVGLSGTARNDVGTVTTLSGVRAGVITFPASGVTSTTTEAACYDTNTALAGVAGGTSNITTFYGLRLRTLSTGPGTSNITNRYGLYQEDTASTNVFMGNVGIGGTPGTMLDLNGVSTGPTITIRASSFTGNQTLLKLDTTGARSVLGSSSTYPLAFDTNGSERMRIDSSGNVGIGATSMSQKLEVVGGLRVLGSASLPAALPAGVFSFETPVLRAYIGDGSGYSWAFSKRASSVTTDLMTILDTGNVGLGIAPSAGIKLNVDAGTLGPVASWNSSNSSGIYQRFAVSGTAIGDIGSALQIFGTGTTTDFGLNSRAGFSLVFGTNQVERMRVTNTGNVGIGTTDPNAKLVVSNGGAVGLEISPTAVASSPALVSYNRSTAATAQLSYVALQHLFQAGSVSTTALTIASTGDVTVAGAFYAATKSFLIPHPSKPGMKLRYGSLESPYHGVRLTGQASVLNGYCRVTLPDYIRDLVKDDGSQVQLTNIRHGKVLWVEDINIAEGTFDVMCETTDRELKFFWSFTAVRKDVPDMIVEE